MTVELVILMISPLPAQTVILHDTKWCVILTLLSELLLDSLVAISEVTEVVEFAANESASLLAKISVGNELDGLIRSTREESMTKIKY